MIFDGDIYDIARFLQGDAPALLGIEPIDGESTKIALGIANVGDGELEIARPAMVEYFANQLEQIGFGPRDRARDQALRPAAYKDTDRRVRGAIVRALASRDMTVGALEKQIGDARVGRLTEALVADGLVERAGRRYRLPL